MAVSTCDKCKELRFDWKEHKCPPEWHIQWRDYHERDEFDTAHSDGDHEDAVEEWIDRRFSDLDYPTELENIFVRRGADGEWQGGYEIEVRSVPEFVIRRKK